jgi:Spy/CpxP family protein refolding chaperone
MSRRILFLTVAAGGLLAFSLAQAQQPGGRRGGGFDPAQMQERMLNAIKEQMGATDNEWSALKPKIEKVMTLQRETRPMMGGRGRGGEGAPSPSKVAQAQRELRTLLDNKSASDAEIGAKLMALRDARERARNELQAAQRDLKQGLTPRQEAVLVMAGLLD